MLISSGQMDTSDVSASSCFSASVAPKTIYIYINVIIISIIIVVIFIVIVIINYYYINTLYIYILYVDK